MTGTNEDPTEAGGEPAGPARPAGEEPAVRRRGASRRWVAVASGVGVIVAAAIVLTVGGWLGTPGGGNQADSGGPNGGPARAGDAGPQAGSGADSSGTSPSAGAGAGGSGQPGGTGGSGGSGGSGTPGSTGGAGGGTNQGGGVPPVLPPGVFPQPPGAGSGPGSGAGGGTAFTAVAGPGCAQAANRGVDLAGGWDQGAGGWRKDGCDGTHRIHGTTATGADPVTWRFEVPAAGACAVEVYVPSGATAPSAIYDVVSGAAVSGFTVDQAGNPDRWVPAGTFRAEKGRFSVRLTDRGDGHTRVAAAALRVTCH